MDLEDHILYGTLMSMKDKYLMRCYKKAIEPLELIRYEIDKDIFTMKIFNPNWEEEDLPYGYTLKKSRSSITDKIMKDK